MSSMKYRAAAVLGAAVAAAAARGLALETGPDPFFPPLVEIPLLEQVLLTVSALLIKPLYMAAALVMVILLRAQERRDIVLIRRGLAAFFVGEAVCAVNFLLTGGSSEVLELLHGAGMVVMGAWLTWGLFEMLDRRVLRFSDPEARCVVQRFCGTCWKRQDAACGMQRLFLFAAPAFAVLALIPLTGPLRSMSVRTMVLDSEVVWTSSPLVQLAEFRLYPIAAALLFAASFVIALRGIGAVAAAKRAFFWGFGLLSYSAMRFFLFNSFAQQLAWVDVWEETTEFIAIAGVAFFLWVFRRQLKMSPE